MSRGKIYSYEALRGMCAIGILFSHMSYLAAADSPFWSAVWQGFMRFGGSCSSFFFVLSGFLAHYTWKNRPFRAYLKSKLARIYPLAMLVFLFALIVTAVLPGNESVAEKAVATGSPLWILNIVLNVFLLKAFVPDERVFYSFHAPSWYLSALFVFYIVAFPFLKRLNAEGTNKRARRLTVSICAGAYALELILCIAAGTPRLQTHSLYLGYINPWFRIFGECFAGILLCEFMPEIQEWIGKKGLNKSLLEISSLTLYLAVFLVRNAVSHPVFSAWLQIVPVAGMLIAFRSDGGVLSAAFRRKGWQLLGGISFELYMTHSFVNEGLPVIFGFANPSLRDWLMNRAGARFMITFTVSILTAFIVHALYKAVFKRKPAQRTAGG